MRLSTSSSVILATLASSVSFGQLAAAAPTDDAVNGLGLSNGLSGLGPPIPVGDSKLLLRNRRLGHAHKIQIQYDALRALTNAERYRSSAMEW